MRPTRAQLRLATVLGTACSCDVEKAPPLAVVTAPRAATPSPRAEAPEVPRPAIRVLLHEDAVENAYPRLSRDGKSVLYQSDRTGKWQLFVMDLESGEQRRVTDDAFNDNFVDWSSDNAWVAFTSDRDGNEEIYRMRIDGSDLERLTDDPARDIHPYFAPDGASILFNSTRNVDFDVYRLTLADKTLVRLTATEENDTCARFSPDMRQIVFLRNDIGMDDVMLLDVTAAAVTNLTNTPAVMDGWPMFSADGKWIYYSTTATGAHALHRVHPDGTGDETLTVARDGEEHGRVFVAHDGATLIFNERRPDGIDISMLTLAD
jgi:TolB protein